ncbi:MAG: 3H domain-containing protein [Culicoidibacterales bacterium]
MSAQRQQAIAKQLTGSGKVTGDQFAKMYQVTRQVIVKDIAILRARGYEIISTPRGYYIPQQQHKKMFVIQSEHEPSIQAVAVELFTIVELGGHVLDVIIEHQVYEEIRIVLDLTSVHDVENFIVKFNKSDDRLLALLTKGFHYHTIEVETMAQKQAILAALQKVNEQKDWTNR